ncbi:cysteine desulfurase family protein [Flavihumibacter petaseus]|uniref:cysteine desulfurase n=1 Tax=Flavihumibacter petaseus NBRC 106054 TaxID=1220578 RepID=A0A0E9N119_9BACT|nr:cysteine desulfurase family protein [Flavihumibacter petaseus]GAO43040.1 cysteine desulfurase [Flavihumibacter petaseus NBRC 106054]
MTSSIYLDNAATTRLDGEVLEAMLPYMVEHYGNPSSTHKGGRHSKIAIETARKTVAQLLGAKPDSIYFTSGGTESNNTAIGAAIRDLGCNYIITSAIEHHAVLHTVEYFSRTYKLPLVYVQLTPEGEVDFKDLTLQLSLAEERGYKPLVSLMHANNEIGSLLDVKRVSDLCKDHKAIFHSDCVQTVGHYPLNLSELGVDFVSGAGHKFHGPKGVGILYVAPSIRIKPLIHGGGQERALRAGTENVYGIVGFGKALERAMACYEKESAYIRGLKTCMREKLVNTIPGIVFNGPENALYTVLSVGIPKTEDSDMLLLNLDLKGICVSGGSACSSGKGGSHVMDALNRSADYTTLRFSFSKYNTHEEVDQVIDALKTALNNH